MLGAAMDHIINYRRLAHLDREKSQVQGGSKTSGGNSCKVILKDIGILFSTSKFKENHISLLEEDAIKA